jgi:hypothetical protein
LKTQVANPFRNKLLGFSCLVDSIEQGLTFPKFSFLFPITTPFHDSLYSSSEQQTVHYTMFSAAMKFLYTAFWFLLYSILSLAVLSLYVCTQMSEVGGRLFYLVLLQYKLEGINSPSSWVSALVLVQCLNQLVVSRIQNYLLTQLWWCIY